jgi:hypothetical protein
MKRDLTTKMIECNILLDVIKKSRLNSSMSGLANGMELALIVIGEREAKYVPIPKSNKDSTRKKIKNFTEHIRNRMSFLTNEKTEDLAYCVILDEVIDEALFKYFPRGGKK